MSYSKKKLKLFTVISAKDFLSKSGYLNRHFDFEVDMEEISRFFYKEANGKKTSDQIMKKYLISKGSNPSDYNL